MSETQSESTLARFGISVPTEVAGRLEALARSAGVSRNSLISQALSEFVNDAGGLDARALIAEALQHALDAHRDEVAALTAERERLATVAASLDLDATEAKVELSRLLAVKEDGLRGNVGLDELRAARDRAAAVSMALGEIEAERALVGQRIAALEDKERALRDSISATARRRLAEAWPQVAAVAEAAGKRFGTALAEVLRVALATWPPVGSRRAARRVVEYAIWNGINAIAEAEDAAQLRRALAACIANIDGLHLQSADGLARALAEETLARAPFPGLADVAKI